MEAQAPTSQPPQAEEAPYIPASQSLPEITVKAIFLGIVLSAVLGGANAYLGLKVGMTVSASIPAAVISMAILRLFRNSNILENNIVQTAASAGESLAAGVIFTLPALIMLQYWQGFEFLPTMAIALSGGVLGVLFTIPLRRALIIEANLQFPEGVATAEVLKAGSEGGEGAKLIAIAGVGGAALKLFQTGFKLIADRGTGAFVSGNTIFGFGSELGVALLGVGYIVGINIAVLVFAGGLISWLFGIPIFTTVMSPEQIRAIGGGAEGYDLAEAIWSARIRYMGVGAMATGGLWALLSLIKPIRDGIRSSFDALREARQGSADSIPRTERDAPINLVLIGMVALAVPLFIVFLSVVDQEALGITGGTYWGTILLGADLCSHRRLLLLVGRRIHGRARGILEQSDLGRHDRDDPDDLADLAGAAGRADRFHRRDLEGHRSRCHRHPGRCRGLLRRGDRWRQSAGPQGRTHCRRHPLQTADHADHRCGCRCAGHRAGAAAAVHGVRPRRRLSPRGHESLRCATRAAGNADELGGRRCFQSQPAVGDDLDRRRHRHRPHRTRPNTEGARQHFSDARAGPWRSASTCRSSSRCRSSSVAWFRYSRERALAKRGASEEQISGAGRRGLLFSSGLITGEALVGIALAVPFAAAQSTEILRLAPEGFETIATGLGVAAFVFFVAWLYRVAKRT